MGCGKSLLLASFLQDLDPNRFCPVLVQGSHLSESQLYRAILEGLKIEAPFFSGQAKQRFFKAIAEQSKKPLIVVDDAQQLQEPALQAITAMLNVPHGSSGALTFLLAGQPELRERLQFTQYLPLRQRIRITCRMPPLSLKETCSYLEHHLRLCGRPIPLFSDDAQVEIHRQAEGIPRVVNTIGYQSLIHAAAAQIALIDSTQLVFDDLSD